MKLVRRARKSIRERRMRACMKDLNSNLEKVERRVYQAHKKERDRHRQAKGLKTGVPPDVLQGRMNPELYAIECRLHKEAGLPPPAPYEGYGGPTSGPSILSRRIGFVEFEAVVQAVLHRNNISLGGKSNYTV